MAPHPKADPAKKGVYWRHFSDPRFKDYLKKAGF